jgi:hypothetical protein
MMQIMQTNNDTPIIYIIDAASSGDIGFGCALF